MGLFRKYRVLKVGNVHIPQIRKFDFTWEGIDDDMSTWYSKTLQISECGKNTYDEAVKVIDKYVKYTEEKVLKYTEKGVLKYPGDKTLLDRIKEYFKLN